MDKLSDQAFEAVMKSIFDIQKELQNIHRNIIIDDVYDPNFENPLVDLLRICVPNVKKALDQCEKEVTRRESKDAPKETPKPKSGTYKYENGKSYVFTTTGLWQRVSHPITYNEDSLPGIPCLVKLKDGNRECLIRTIEGEWWVCVFP